MSSEVEVRRLGLLASALAGRRLAVTHAEPGTATWTDGLTVYVDRQLNAQQTKQAVVVQAALIGAGSLEPTITASLRRRGDLCARYLAVEGQRALASLEALLPAHALSLLGPSRPPATAAESLEIAMSGVPIVAPPVVFGQIRPRALRSAAVATRNQSAHLPLRADSALEEMDDAAEADGGEGADLSSPVGGGGAIGRLLQRLTSAGRARDTGTPGAPAATHLARGAAKSSHRGRAVLATAQPGDRAGLARAVVLTYPEWDCHRSAYRGDWCTVRLREAIPAPHPLPASPSRALHRALGRVMPDLTRMRRQLQGDELDIDATVSERADLAAGVTPNEAVYVDSVRRRRDLAVLILLDVSASAAEPSATGGSVHEHQLAAAASLAMTLHDLGDRVAVDAFRSMGRDNVEVVAVKRFDEPAGNAVLRRIAGLVPGAYTRLGAAIRHGCATLEAEAGTARRLLIVVSDGFAYDHGYEGRYGEADARRALAEARRNGVGCLCLSIGAVTEAAALTRVFGTAAHASIAHLDELPAIAATLFPAALRSADHRRRTWQHSSRSRQRQELDRRTA